MASFYFENFFCQNFLLSEVYKYTENGCDGSFYYTMRRGGTYGADNRNNGDRRANNYDIYCKKQKMETGCMRMSQYIMYI